MAEAAKRSERPTQWRRRLAGTLFSFFPAMVAVGLLAPGYVRVLQAPEGGEAIEQPLPILDQPLQVRPTLLVPRDFSTGFIPELLDIDQLFRRTRYRVDPATRRLAGLLSFPRNRGDVIVLDDVDKHVRGLLFKDALSSTSVVDSVGLGGWQLLPLQSTLPSGNGVRFDDSVTSGQRIVAVVPEPSTAPLLAAGLAYLARRRRRIAASPQ